MEHIQTTIRKANKEHKCCLCLGKIEKGTKYETRVQKESDSIYSFKNHIHCIEIAEKLNMFYETNDEGLSSDSFIEFVIGEYENISKEPLNKIDYYQSFLKAFDAVLKHHKIDKTFNG